MKKIGIISDTHGYLDERILHYLRDRDEIWHAGDWGGIAVADQLRELAPLRGVYGNIDCKDIRIEFPKTIRFMCEKLEVLMTHIGGYPGKYAPDIRAEIKAHPPGLFICGHSHIIKIMRDPKLGLIHINPGAAGRSGFHKVRTLVLLEVNSDKLQNIQAVELGPRGSVAEEEVR